MIPSDMFVTFLPKRDGARLMRVSYPLLSQLMGKSYQIGENHLFKFMLNPKEKKIQFGLSDPQEDKLITLVSGFTSNTRGTPSLLVSVGKIFVLVGVDYIVVSGRSYPVKMVETGNRKFLEIDLKEPMGMIP